MSEISTARYDTGWITMGHYEDKQEQVSAIFMPRDVWVGLVESCLQEGDVFYTDIEEEMKETAENMTHYPLGTWMDDDRGCGCVVGEFLIASDIVHRTPENDNDTVINALGKMGWRGEQLNSFGNAIDVKLRSHLNRVGNNGSPNILCAEGDLDQVVVFI